MKYLLVDNGSLRADSVLNLRRVAAALSKKEGVEVIPASLLHSSKISSDELDNEPAVNLEPRLNQLLKAGEREFTLIPFFFGPTGAIVDYLPQRLAMLKQRHGDFSIQRTPFLFDDSEDEANRMLISILAGNVRQIISRENLKNPKVALVDHGSPLPEVTEVRNRVAEFLGKELNQLVEPASMERRPEDEYAFNEPLLENLLVREGWKESEIVLAMLFLSPGRHAGSEGDVATICKEAQAKFPRLVTYMTNLVGTHPDIVELLANRLKGMRLPLE